MHWSDSIFSINRTGAGFPFTPRLTHYYLYAYQSCPCGAGVPVLSGWSSLRVWKGNGYHSRKWLSFLVLRNVPKWIIPFVHILRFICIYDFLFRNIERKEIHAVWSFPRLKRTMDDQDITIWSLSGICKIWPKGGYMSLPHSDTWHDHTISEKLTWQV